jgi:hypothetical protein
VAGQIRYGRLQISTSTLGAAPPNEIIEFQSTPPSALGAAGLCFFAPRAAPSHATTPPPPEAPLPPSVAALFGPASIKARSRERDIRTSTPNDFLSLLSRLCRPINVTTGRPVGAAFHLTKANRIESHRLTDVALAEPANRTIQLAGIGACDFISMTPRDEIISVLMRAGLCRRWSRSAIEWRRGPAVLMEQMVLRIR